MADAVARKGPEDDVAVIVSEEGGERLPIDIAILSRLERLQDQVALIQATLDDLGDSVKRALDHGGANQEAEGAG